MRKIIGIVAVVATTACAGQGADGEDAYATQSSELVASNRLAANRLAANRLAANRLAANRLAANRLAANRIALNALAAEQLLTTVGGRELLSYMASCALPASVTLEAELDGETLSFPGSVGLAPAWADRALHASEQRWVSACLLARVNAHDTSVQVSLRGPHPALRADGDERALYSLEEGAFWGNIFTDDADAWWSCEGEDQAQGETGDLVQRDCAEPATSAPEANQCGFAFAGACGGTHHAVCRGYDHHALFYTHCGAGHALTREVITTFVRP